MKRIIAFFKESFSELRKVVWPSRDEVMASTKVVVVSTLLIALILGVVDFFLMSVVKVIF